MPSGQVSAASVSRATKPVAFLRDLNQRQLLPLFMRAAWPLLLTIAILGAVLIGFGANPFRTLDRHWGDQLLNFRFRAGLEPRPDPRVFLIGIETSDLVGAGTTEAEYKIYADLLDSLADLQVSAVGMDLIMARGGQADSQRVMEAIRNNGHVVLAEARTATMVARSFLFMPKAEFPAGEITINADSDGVHRHYRWGISDEAGCVPSLALATYLASFRPAKQVKCEDEELVWKELGPDLASLVDQKLPTGDQLLNFRSSYKEPWDRGFKFISVSQLRDKYKAWKAAGGDPTQVPPGLPARGNLAIVGFTGVGDSGPTPFGRAEPLVQLHATALDDLLEHRTLKEFSPLGTALLTFFAVLLIMAIASWVRGVPWLLFWCGAAIVAVVAIGFVILLRGGILMPAVTPAIFMAAAVFGESGRRATMASLDKATLGRYFSPNVLKDVLKNPEVMQPREADLTVLLTDVRNFTNITEQFGTKRIFDLLNDVFEVETRAVIDTDGSMEHFVGDQFVGYWGAPQVQPDAADLALAAGARIIRELDALHETLEPGVKELFGFGLAIHRGKALFGNKGARVRLDYGILGDIINGCARIESLTKTYGVRQIITREVLDKATSKPPVRYLDKIRVKGKKEPMEMFEVLINPTDERFAIVKAYEDAWRKYEAGAFAEAAAMFDKLQDRDKPSHVLYDRCKGFEQEPPPDWKGVFEFKEK
jgi:class 3 adenylate cyclase/CHASE2 domain-containing sensor protein